MLQTKSFILEFELMLNSSKLNLEIYTVLKRIKVYQTGARLELYRLL